MARITLFAALLTVPLAAAAVAPAQQAPIVKPVPARSAGNLTLAKPGSTKPGFVKLEPVKPMSTRPVAARSVPPKLIPSKPSPAPHPAPSAPPVAASAPPSDGPAKGSNTGLPLPRFASLKTDEVNLRSGPGTRYPIEWVYKRHDLPVQIEREFEVWRLVADAEGTKGWVHQATLVGRRTFVVREPERTLREDAKPDAPPVARLKPGVIGRIRSCEANADWCQVQIGDYRGWLSRDAFWGTYPKEAIQ